MINRERVEIGPYRVEEVLGSGATSIVYRARASDGSVVALKVLADRSETAHARFERQAAARVEHANVARIVDAAIDRDGRSWIATELVEGTSLDRMIGSRPLELARAHDIGLALCAALGAAHAARVFHGDLKPSNVLIGAGDAVALRDFGGAGFVSSTSVAPEQARGEAVLDERTDVWGLGALLYQAIAGEPPFLRASPLGELVAVATEPVPQLMEVSRTLARVVQRALARSKNGRFANMADFAEALRASREASAHEVGNETASLSWSAELEQRTVTLLLAEGVKSSLRFEERVRTHGGELVPLIGARSIAVFGELASAARAAIACREEAARVVIASRRGALSAAANVASATAALAFVSAELEGVAIDADSARSLVGVFSLVEAAPGIFELSDGAARPRPPRAAPSGLLGRELEVAVLERELARAQELARPRAVSVIGPPGIGKSRLIEAFAARHASLIGADASFVERQHALHRLGIDAAGRARVGVAKGSVALIVIDDGAPCAIGERAALIIYDGAGPSDALTLELPALFTREASLFANAVAGRSLPESVLVELAARTRGNPLFIEQLVLAMIEQHAVTISDERTLEQAIAVRIESLPPVERWALRDAAALAAPFEEKELDRAVLLALVRKGFLVRAGDRYAFKSRAIATSAR